MNDSDLKAVNTFANDKRVRPSVSAAPLDADRATARYTFPAHSLTILKLKWRR
jgi:hypothetical protein